MLSVFLFTVIEEKQMNLSKTERYLISNQLRILIALDRNDANTNDTNTPAANSNEAYLIAIENGYEYEYTEIMANIYENSDALTSSECNEVQETLLMFRVINKAMDKFPASNFTSFNNKYFDGYDGNHESKFSAYAAYIINIKKLFEEQHKGKDFLFTTGSIHRKIYQNMLIEYNKLSVEEQTNLTLSQLKNIL